MKLKSLIATAGLFAALTLSGCSMFYPIPAPAPTATVEPTETPTPTPSQSVDPDLKKIELNVLNATAFRDNGTVTVIAEAMGVMEEDGKCTLQVTQGKATQTVTVNSEPNVTSTQCFPMEVPIDDFQNGQIMFSISYMSSKSAGVIKTGTLKVE